MQSKSGCKELPKKYSTVKLNKIWSEKGVDAIHLSCKIGANDYKQGYLISVLYFR